MYGQNQPRADPTHGLHRIDEVIRAMKPAWEQQRETINHHGKGNREEVFHL